MKPLRLPVALFTCLLASAISPAGAANFETFQAADLVIGQPNFTTGAGVAAQSNNLYGPTGVAVDPTTKKVFVSDGGNNRILRYASLAAAQNGATPEAVIGQPNLTSGSANQGGAAPTAATLSGQVNIFVDTSGRLWVADRNNNRVLGYENASTLATNSPANHVLGQASFTTSTSGSTANTMLLPYSVCAGPGDTLWVSDTYNSRVLRFANITSKGNGADADGVLGQTNLTNSTDATSQDGMYYPCALWADAGGRLWVIDSFNNRVLRFDNAVAKADTDGALADGVLGRPDFTTGGSGLSASGLSGPFGVFFDAFGDLWVSDYYNRRVLRFTAAATLANGAAASLVLGEPNFTASSGGTTSQLLASASQVSPGLDGSVLVVDTANNRVLRFSPLAAPAAPGLTISGKKRYATTKAKVKVKGLATGSVTSVTYRVGKKGGYKTASSAAGAWKFKAKLKPGKNVVTVRATGPGGTMTATKKITRE